MAGASAFQIGTAIYSEGPEVFKTICTGLEQWMKHHQVKTLSELVGVAHQ
jgi:dihydroorotate dehydrogenase